MTDDGYSAEAEPPHSPRTRDRLAMAACLSGILIAIGAFTARMDTLPAHPFSLHADDPSLPAMLEAVGITGLRIVGCLILAFGFSLGSLALTTGSTFRRHTALRALDMLSFVPVCGLAALGVPLVFGPSLLPFDARMAGELLIDGVGAAALAFPVASAVLRARDTLPIPLMMVTQGFRLRAWPSFWRLHVPFVMPALAHATVRAMPQTWTGLVLAEMVVEFHALPVAQGLGAQAAAAMEHEDIARLSVLIGLTAVLVGLIDHLLIRPFRRWSGRFEEHGRSTEAGLIRLLKRLAPTRLLLEGLTHLMEAAGTLPLGARPVAHKLSLSRNLPVLESVPWIAGLCGLALALFIGPSFHVLKTIGVILTACLASVVALVALLALNSLVWLPLSFWLAGRSKKIATPLLAAARFLILFPVFLLFPPIMTAAGPFSGLVPFLFFGFPSILLLRLSESARLFPRSFLDVMRVYRIPSRLRWMRIILPGLRPAWIVGCRRASFWMWNASIAAAVTVWGERTFDGGFGIGSQVATALRDEDPLAGTCALAAITFLAVLCDEGLRRTPGPGLAFQPDEDTSQRTQASVNDLPPAAL
ncbi:nitrate ABC transporter permease [Acetobacter estunensis NRIC 0472]|uniref:ABC transporter permease subunit n=1 Tax=Acetobacter estunensis TaxID=104097 RepID=UPI001F552E4B|nr:ABC transporter permease subunit [Acetobacter estunensis]GBQ21084.1 nitrate ABC transporter permease [Acetobacter estunensis NRIC 0472]